MQWSALVSPVHAAGVSEAVVRQLGERIGSGVLVAGTPLPAETELADLFVVSPMTIRSALQVLREHGLIQTRRGRRAGSFVHEHVADRLLAHDRRLPTVSEFTDFTVWREAISGEACARAAERMTPSREARLQALVDEVESTDRTMSVYRFADAKLHLFIAECADSDKLLEAERVIQDTLTRAFAPIPRGPGAAASAAQNHVGLVQAVLEHSPMLARQRFSEHARASLDLLVGVAALR